MGKIYEIQGWFKKKGQKLKFTKEIEANSEDRALEILYSDVGSKHRAKRNMINISRIRETKEE